MVFLWGSSSSYTGTTATATTASSTCIIDTDSLNEMIKQKLEEAFRNVLTTTEIESLAQTIATKVTDLLNEALTNIKTNDVPTFISSVKQAFEDAVNQVTSDPTVIDYIKSKIEGVGDTVASSVAPTIIEKINTAITNATSDQTLITNIGSAVSEALKSLLMDIWPNLQQSVIDWVNSATQFIADEVKTKVEEGVTAGIENADVPNLVATKVTEGVSAGLQSVDMISLVQEKLQTVTSDAIAQILQGLGFKVYKPSMVDALFNTDFKTFYYLALARNAFIERLAEKLGKPITLKAKMYASVSYDCNGDSTAEPVTLETDEITIDMNKSNGFIGTKYKCPDGKLTNWSVDEAGILRTYGATYVYIKACQIYNGSACVGTKNGGLKLEWVVPEEVKPFIRGMVAIILPAETSAWTGGKVSVKLSSGSEYAPSFDYLIDEEVHLFKPIDPESDPITFEMNFSASNRRGTDMKAIVMLV